MPLSAMFACDVIAISILTFALYFPRHRRRDMLVAYLGINIGVMAVTQTLASASISAGLGLGLFGVLSIIRLRSSELDQEEVAYYFAALALGLIGGISVNPAWLTPALMAAMLAVIFIGDHPSLLGRYRVQVLTLDRAYTDEPILRQRLEELLNAKVHRVHVRRVDLVSDTTNVQVRYEQLDTPRPPDSAYHTAEFEVSR